MNVRQINDLVAEILKEIDLYSEEALTLLMGTIAHESHFKYNRQLEGGPARSLFQIEPATAYDNIVNYINFRSDLKDKIWRTSFLNFYFMREPINKQMEIDTLSKLLERNFAFATCMARVKYLRAKGPIPRNLPEMAAYWKEHYNSYFGAGSIEEFIINFHRSELPEIV